MSLFKRLFGGGGEAPSPKAESQEYAGFTITPTPIAEGGQFRVSARIEALIDGEEKRHELIRADVIRDLDEATDMSVRKAKQLIDQMGNALF
ncbi:Transcriptional activator HlyU [Shimia sp. SK013]|uniref:HlyU family transcriptional regulator n=1 Tax=Shimia sp. SK013 TaxID=1389006 RepID=UPI0006B5B5A3|nr:HlyU family transcriptional regulator [Shimia sp. SK013]KPA23097.1 Transcriptional activator HlyU [Shimia sp. SK013]